MHHAETTNPLEVRLEVASPLLVITDVMTAEAPILGLKIDFRLINLESTLGITSLDFSFKRKPMTIKNQTHLTNLL